MLERKPNIENEQQRQKVKNKKYILDMIHQKEVDRDYTLIAKRGEDWKVVAQNWKFYKNSSWQSYLETV